MALAICSSSVDSTGRELVEHGTSAFPLACYHDDLIQCPVPWHWHEELEAAIVTQGEALIAAGPYRQIVPAGHGVFINTGVLHGAWSACSSGCRCHSLVFQPNLVGGRADSAANLRYVQPLVQNSALDWILLSPDIPWQKQALEAIEAAWQAAVREEEGFEFAARHSLSQLILAIWKNMPDARHQPDSKVLRDGQRIKTMLSYIHQHFPEEISISQIAAAASVSESECLRCFHSAIGTTPIQYTKHYRIRQAARLLDGSDAKVSEIASQCGFQDMSYFSKVFRQQMGHTPSQYRNAMRRSP